MRRSKYTIEELLAGITEENIHPAVDWGPDVGKKILPPELFYRTGDATLPQGRGPGVIAHICNDLGQWGKGFVLPLGKRYPDAEKHGKPVTETVGFLGIGPDAVLTNHVDNPKLGRDLHKLYLPQRKRRG